jgi:flagellar hook-length control protein FliK
MPATSMPPTLCLPAAAPLPGTTPGAEAPAGDATAPLAGFAELLRQKLLPGDKGEPQGLGELPAQLLAAGGADSGMPAAPEQQPPDAAVATLLQALLAQARDGVAPHAAGAEPGAGALTAVAGAPARAAPVMADATASATGPGREPPLMPALAADKPAAADFAARLTAAAAETAGQGAAPKDASVPGVEPAAPALAAATHGVVAARDTVHAAHIETALTAAGWEREIGQKVVLLVGRNEQRAELTLTPPSLGKVDVTLTVSGDQTSALFVSANPTVREALEQALPRLREMLADAGVQLGQAQVSAGSSQGNGDQQERPPASGAGSGGRGPADSAATTVSHWVRRGDGLIDTFV